MTRLFLAAGVAALAIATPAVAKPGEHGGGNQAQAAPRGGGGGRPQAAFRGGGGGGGGPGMQSFAPRGGGGGGGPRFQAAPRMQRFAMPRQERSTRFAMPRQERAQRFAQPRMERQRFASMRERGSTARMAERQQFRGRQPRMAERGGFNRQVQARNERQQLRVSQQANNRAFQRQRPRANRIQQAQNNRALRRQQSQLGRTQFAQNNRAFGAQQVRGNKLAQLQARSALLSTQQLRSQRMALSNPKHFNQLTSLENRIATPLDAQGTRFTDLTLGNGSQVFAPMVVDRFVGAPITTVATVAALSPLPPAISYLYPDTPDYYYRYGDGYLFEVDRGSNLVAAMLPLLAGGYLPGEFLPTDYMASYVPPSYGFEGFYPDSGEDCYRYGEGVVYDVDCYSGFVEDVIPLYAGGYGVGQILPASYAYYNVPYQYRSVYYNTPRSSYWYAPGAIYQYEPRTSMITSVAALLAPGFTIGQPLPAGYEVYNVPLAYRATYYDTPAAWYRYNNGYIYRIDPNTTLVTAIVASLLT